MAYQRKSTRNRRDALSEQDIARARVAVRRRLEASSPRGRPSDDCGDPALGALLQRIERARLAQESRLLDWLLKRDPDREQNPGAGFLEGAPENTELASQSPDTQEPEAAAAESKFAGSWHQVQLTERRDVTEDLMIITLSRPSGFEFAAGQYAKLRLDGVARDYSIVSSPHEAFLEFFIELMPGGRMSQRLRQMVPGDRIGLGARPKGRFGLDGRFPNQLMVATVTGVNPFLSMLRSYLHEGRRGQRFYLLHGASYQDEFGYRDELERMAGAHPDLLSYVPTVSRPGEPRNTGWTGERGRVDTIADKYIDQLGLSPDSTVLYACGHPQMVDIVEARFASQDFEVKVERY